MVKFGDNRFKIRSGNRYLFTMEPESNIIRCTGTDYCTDNDDITVG